eukprot:2506200-Rhodomonas_salina.2
MNSPYGVKYFPEYAENVVEGESVSSPLCPALGLRCLALKERALLPGDGNHALQSREGQQSAPSSAASSSSCAGMSQHVSALRAFVSGFPDRGLVPGARARRVATPLSAYAPAMECPVPRRAALLLRCWYHGAGPVLRWAVPWVCYALSGTEKGCGAAPPLAAYKSATPCPVLAYCTWYGLACSVYEPATQCPVLACISSVVMLYNVWYEYEPALRCWYWHRKKVFVV